MLQWLFKKNHSPKAIVFVDYEYWYYSYKNRFNVYPDPGLLRRLIEEKYTVEDIMIFADFSQPGLSEEIGKLRQVTNTIIETGDTTTHRKKDMTDFVILNYIYQYIEQRKDIQTYILFTGDGHFLSVVNYLIQKKKKNVILYGVQDTVSQRLRATVSELVLLPTEEDLERCCERSILKDLAFCVDNGKTPTFSSTVDIVARRHHLPIEEVRVTLTRMINQGYIYKREHRINFNQTIPAIAADWEKLIQDGLWNPERE